MARKKLSCISGTFIVCSTEFNLKQLVSNAARLTNIFQSILELQFVSNVIKEEEVKVIEVLSGHKIVFLTLELSKNEYNITQKCIRRDFQSADDVFILYCLD